jgi:hypothetical protein
LGFEVGEALVHGQIVDTIRPCIQRLAMDSLEGQQLFQSRLCQQLSLLTAVSESLTERILKVENRLDQLQAQLNSRSAVVPVDWDGAAELLAGTEERLSRLERLLDDGTSALKLVDPFPEDEIQEFPEDGPQLFPEELGPPLTESV